jgi:hypothetical protein
MGTGWRLVCPSQGARAFIPFSWMGHHIRFWLGEPGLVGGISSYEGAVIVSTWWTSVRRRCET